MRFRTYKNTELTVSEVGFGLWTISTGWWGNFTEGEAIALMHKAFDLGITWFSSKDSRLKNRACVNVGERPKGKAIGSAHK
jgi:predicted aldo/keto reductase-like oxidoreductase